MIYNMKSPMISVVMSVYNGLPFLSEAIESILNQTWGDFEFIIINDASTDDSLNIIQSFKDPRIHVIQNTENLGLTRSLNRGLKAAQGKYIARMDADDISFPERLFKQINFMEKHPEAGVCGSWCEIIGEDAGRIEKPSSDTREIQCRLLFGNVLVHSSVVLRKSLLEEKGGYYDESFCFVEDYELWTRLVFCSHITNIPEPLLYYRNHYLQKTSEYNTSKIEPVKNEISRIYTNQLQRLQMNLKDIDLKAHMAMGVLPFNFNADRIPHVQIEKWIEYLIEFNKKFNLYPEPMLKQIIAEQWLKLKKNNLKYSYVTKFCLEQLIQKKNLTPQQMYNLGAVLKSLMKYEESEQWFDKIRQTDEVKQFPGVYFHLGEIALQKNDEKAALNDFKECVRLCPDHQKALCYIQRLEKSENKGI